MAKLRKMLGRVDEPNVVALMRTIETQSHATLVTWSTGYAQEHVLPIFEKAFPHDDRPRVALETARAALVEKSMLSQAKAAIKDARIAAKEAAARPEAQAAAAAVATAAATITTPTNALGMTFYAAAALTYDRLGTDASAEAYDDAATQELGRMADALSKVAVPNESNPVRVSWNC